MNFFSSDTHYGHGNIIRYCNRPFLKAGDLDKEGNWVNKEIANIRCKEMDNLMIHNCNQRVKENDVLYFLGDFCFLKSTEAQCSRKKAYEFYRNQLICKNIIFVNGNHDKNNGVKTCIQGIIIRQGKRNIKLVHNPAHLDDRYPLHFTGHVHNNWEIKRFIQKDKVVDCINMSVDVWNFQPITFNEIMKRYTHWLKQKIHD